MIPHELTRRFANGKGAIFVGAGLSKGAGYKDWKELVDPLHAPLGLAKTLGYTPEQLAGWYEVAHGRAELMKFLDKELSADRPPTECHRLIAGLPVDLYFTTNFDTLLEAVLPGAEVVVNDVDFSKLDAPAHKQIVKVHGDLGNTDSIVFTKSDYDHYLEKRPAIAELIRLTLMQRTVLFLGYSFSDRNLTTLLAQVGRRLGDSRRTLYAVVFDPQPYMKRELEKMYGVTVIEPPVPADGDKSKVLRKWLERFAAQIERERKGCADTTVALPVSALPAQGARFLGRGDEIDEVISAFGAARIVGIEGPSGMGKTALAVEVAKRCEFGRAAELKPDEQLFAHAIYIDAAGFCSAEKLQAHIVEKLADLFRVSAVTGGNRDDSRPTASLAEREQYKARQIRMLLKVFRVLIVVDNIELRAKDGMAAWLEQVPAPSAVLVVSREKFRGAPVSIQVGGLALDAGMAILIERLAERHLDATGIDVRALLGAAGGNPQAIKMLVGQLATGIPPCRQATGCAGILEHSWQHMGEDGRSVLVAASVFNTGHIAEDALAAASGLGPPAFGAALATCESLSLLERCTEPWPGTGRVDGFRLHPQPARFARAVLEQDRQRKNGIYARLAVYYREFARRAVVRSDPPVPYWNAVVTQDMLEIDDEWPNIRDVMRWAQQRETGFVVDMVYLLVHYMDTRLLNNDRIIFSRVARDACGARGDVLGEALLRIDALGWTLIEDNRLAEAEEEIQIGLRLLDGLEHPGTTELRALALTWQARAALVGGATALAQELVDEALARSCDEKNWIRYRARMVAGDIAAKVGEFSRAVGCYEECRRLVDSYGGEEGYQMLPRLGMALLLDGKREHAAKVFGELLRISMSDRIEIGILYARYGFAYLAISCRAHFDKASFDSAHAQLEQLRAQLLRATTSNLLHRLMNELEASLDA